MEARGREEEVYEVQARLCRALSSPLRLRILHELRDGECAAGELRERFGLSRALLSQHMSVLQEHRLVIARRDGARTFYRLSDPIIAVACELVRLTLERLLADTPGPPDVNKTVDS